MIEAREFEEIKVVCDLNDLHIMVSKSFDRVQEILKSPLFKKQNVECESDEDNILYMQEIKQDFEDMLSCIPEILVKFDRFRDYSTRDSEVDIARLLQDETITYME